MRMRAKDKMAGAAFALALLATQACAGTGAPPAAAAGPSAATGRVAAGDSAELAELEALYLARADSVRMRYAEADVHFMQGMIAHHAQALVMSGLAPSRAGSDALQTLAARTINAQNDEIETMQTWLGERGETMPDIEISGTRLTVGGVMDMGSMPGMLTEEQMGELEAARGEEFDRLFLTYMIQHHSGAVTMVHELFATDGAALDDTVFKIASDIQVDQTTEINRMELMLEAMGDARP